MGKSQNFMPLFGSQIFWVLCLLFLLVVVVVCCYFLQVHPLAYFGSGDKEQPPLYWDWISCSLTQGNDSRPRKENLATSPFL